MVAFYSKHNRLSLSLFTVNPVAIVAQPYYSQVQSALLEECPRTTTSASQCWFSGHFRHVFFNTIALPRINIGADVWGESSITGMTGVYQRWCSSTLHIGWGLCDRVCQVLVCRDSTVWRGCFFSSFWVEFGRSRTGEGSSGGRKNGVV